MFSRVSLKSRLSTRHSWAPLKNCHLCLRPAPASMSRGTIVRGCSGAVTLGRLEMATMIGDSLMSDPLRVNRGPTHQWYPPLKWARAARILSTRTTRRG